MVSPYSLSVPGGAQGQVKALSAALCRLGVSVDVLAPAVPRTLPALLGGARFVPLGRSLEVAVNGSRAPVAPFPSAVARTLRRLSTSDYDIVHLHEPFVPGPTLAALARGPRPIVGTFHRAGADTAYRALAAVLGRLAGRLDASVAVSDEALATMRSVLGRHVGDVEVLWNGVDVRRLANAPPASSDVPVVLFVGRHEPRKGLAVLLQALDMLDDELAVWVCGAGPETASLRSAHRDPRIEWLGRIDDDDLASRLAGATVLAAPALGGESFGLVVAEAMAAGTPVVASDIPGYRAALAGAGLLVPPGDAGALAEALRLLLGDERRRRELSEASAVRARELSIDRLAERYLSIYEAVAGGPGT